MNFIMDKWISEFYSKPLRDPIIMTVEKIFKFTRIFFIPILLYCNL